MNSNQEIRRERPYVVVAEDSPTQAELLREALAGDGYEVALAANGLDALAAARARRPLVIVTDVVMPDMDGYQLCRAVKADAELREVPVMIVTSLREIDDIVMALECGADNFIRKPFDPRALLARLDFLLANRKLRSHSKLQFGIEISLGGRKHLITAEREQILDLLFSSYEEALQANEELRQRQEEVQKLNLEMAAHAVRLEQANEQLRAFSHTVSHDLRSPLSNISGFSSILQHKYADALDGKARRYLDAIESESARMMRIVEDVLYLAHIDREKVGREPVDLAALAAEIVDSLRDAHPQRAVVYEGPAAAACECDPRLVRIALANLLGNAWKFTARRPQARVRFTVQPQGDGVVFCVEDDGAGFDMAYADRLFKPFERLHPSHEFEGFGVGLATVQRIVNLHGGRIWAEGQPGRGARFCFTLSARGQA